MWGKCRLEYWPCRIDPQIPFVWKLRTLDSSPNSSSNLKMQLYINLAIRETRDADCVARQTLTINDSYGEGVWSSTGDYKDSTNQLMEVMIGMK